MGVGNAIASQSSVSDFTDAAQVFSMVAARLVAASARASEAFAAVSNLAVVSEGRARSASVCAAFQRANLAVSSVPSSFIAARRSDRAA